MAKVLCKWCGDIEMTGDDIGQVISLCTKCNEEFRQETNQMGDTASQSGADGGPDAD